MPTFTTIAIDRLIEQKTSKPMAAGKNSPESKLERSGRTSAVTRQGSGTNGTDKKPQSRNGTPIVDRKHHWTQISPALYSTPESTPLPDSPSSFPPSPYIVNHKRRGPRLSKAFSEVDVARHQAPNDIVKSSEAEDIESLKAVGITDDVSRDVEENRVKFLINGDLGNNIGNDNAAGQGTSRKSVVLERENEVDDFFDPQDSMSAKSSTDGESNYALERSLNLNASVSEFYDAWEDLSSDGGSHPPASDIEAELHEIRLSLLKEMEKRKQAEGRLNYMRSQWGRIREQLSLVGLTLPADPTTLQDEPADDPAQDLCRQVHLVRFVANSIGRGIAKAELEVEMEAQIEAKNFEIARLLDKLRYYEAVNHEMSQRNQETIETMRRLRQRRKRRQRWIWCSAAAAITVGSVALAWSYLPTGKGSSSVARSTSHTSEGTNRPA